MGNAFPVALDSQTINQFFCFIGFEHARPKLPPHNPQRMITYSLNKNALGPMVTSFNISIEIYVPVNIFFNTKG